jgi:uncharacterized protein (DUF433 family)
LARRQRAADNRDQAGAGRDDVAERAGEGDADVADARRRVESVPGKVSGAWVFKGTRTPVAVVFDNLEDGLTIDEVSEQFPMTREQIQAVLRFAARSLDAPAVAG